MKYYLAGPMTGKPLYNFPAFKEAAQRWRDLGHFVVSPHQLTDDIWMAEHGRFFDPAVDKCEWGDPIVKKMIAEDLRQVMECDAVLVLDGWEESKGATLEVRLAKQCGMPVLRAGSDRHDGLAGIHLTDDYIDRVTLPGAIPEPPSEKPTNPKDAIGSDKVPLHLWPEVATVHGSLAMLDGALKYGRSNFRAIGVRSTIYYDACRRHLSAWFEGEDTAADSGVSHLGHALACIAILLDASAAGKLNDDRMVRGGYDVSLAELTPHVARLKEKYKDRNPRHYTIADGDV